MSKPKFRRKTKRASSDHIDSIDEATSACEKIAAIGQLLASCQPEYLQTETISVAGAFVMDEAIRLRQHLDTFLQKRRKRRSQPS